MDTTTKAIANAMEMADFWWDNDDPHFHAQVRPTDADDAAIARFVAELGEQGYAIVPVGPLSEVQYRVVRGHTSYPATATDRWGPKYVKQSRRRIVTEWTEVES